MALTKVYVLKILSSRALVAILVRQSGHFRELFITSSEQSRHMAKCLKNCIRIAASSNLPPEHTRNPGRRCRPHRLGI